MAIRVDVTQAVMADSVKFDLILAAGQPYSMRASIDSGQCQIPLGCLSQTLVLFSSA